MVLVLILGLEKHFFDDIVLKGIVFFKEIRVF